MTAIRLLQLNDVKLSGRLTRDPELKLTSKGQPVCRFDLALNRNYKDTNGEWQQEVTYVSIVAWREAAQRCADRLKKGSPVYVDGYLKSRAWETKEGQKRTSLEVIAQRIQFLAKMEGEKDSSDSAEAAGEPAVAAVAAGSSSDEDIPF